MPIRRVVATCRHFFDTAELHQTPSSPRATMVRKGSPVRVRQRALEDGPPSRGAPSLGGCGALRREPLRGDRGIPLSVASLLRSGNGEAPAVAASLSVYALGWAPTAASGR